MERLQKVIASSGITSRRKAEELILKGKVFVNGEKVVELGRKVSGDDSIVVDGIELKKEDKVYYILNKPRGVVCSVSDELGRKTVVDLIDTNKRIYPIGRLDYDTTGVIILTNDGTLANNLMHPSKHIEKTYVAKLNKIITLEDVKKLKSGVMIDGVKCVPTKVKVRKTDIENDKCLVEISIIEGRNHIIKRLFESLGYLVDKLTRIKYAFLTVEDLKSGEYRTLSIKEVKKLYSMQDENRKAR